ncbi:MAG: IclR family transcriptional regulator [Bacillota bacterium]
MIDGFKGVRSVKKALDILDCFSFEKVELGVVDLAQALNMPKATVSRLAGELVKNGYLEQDGNSKKYRLGLKLFYLGSIVFKQMKIAEVALPVMYRIRDRTGESVHLNIIKDNERMCLEYVECSHDLRPIVHVGQRSPLYAGASAKVLLAYMKESEVDEVIAKTRLARITGATICDPRKLKEELAGIRQQGYAFSIGERIPGLVSISAPVRNHTGQVIASLSLAVPEVRLDKGRVAETIALIKEGALQLSVKLGWNPEFQKINKIHRESPAV